MSGRVVAVTGATGYVATELIKQLLANGYTVRGTVRSLADEKKLAHLKSFPGGKLELFEADLLAEGSFDHVFIGCEGVFHTASPFRWKVSDPQRDLIEPALNGTRNVLRAVEKSTSVKTVVVTSSTAAVISYGTADPSYVWSEKDWNTTSNLKSGPYLYSKVLAEKAAWEWAKDHPHVRLVAMNPGMILGPVSSNRSDGESIEIFSAFLNGKAKRRDYSEMFGRRGRVGLNEKVRRESLPPIAMGIVDVRDVAKAHIASFEKNVHGRFLLNTPEGIPFMTLVDYLRPEFSHYPLPDKTNGHVLLIPKFSRERAEKELGMTFTDIRKTAVDMAHSLIANGIVTQPSRL